MLEVPQIEIILYKYYLAYYSRIDLRVLLSQLLSLLDNLFNGSHHVESLLRQGVIFTLEMRRRTPPSISNPLYALQNVL